MNNKKQEKYEGIPPGTRDMGNNQAEHIASDAEMTCSVAQKLNTSADRLSDNTISLAIRAQEARKFLDWHTDHVRAAWLDWLDESNKTLESIRQTRVAIGFESKQLLSECSDVRKFFLSEDHDQEIKKLREFIELAERLRSLKNDGTLDRLADTILKLA
jgi:hypothetical protein